MTTSVLGILCIALWGICAGLFSWYAFDVARQVTYVTLADGTFTSADDQSELLSDYRGYQYYRLFDSSAD